MKQWRLDNKERWDAINAKSREKNRDRTREKQKERYHATKHLAKPFTEEQKVRRAINNRRFLLMREYGITPEDFNMMHENQKGLCAICNKPELVKANLAVDHDHNTGKVRGLLCSTCNHALGAFGDSVELLHKAIAYLESDLEW